MMLQAALQDTEAQLAHLLEQHEAQQTEIESQAQQVLTLQQLATEAEDAVKSSGTAAQAAQQRLEQEVVTLQVLLIDPAMFTHSALMRCHDIASTCTSIRRCCVQLHTAAFRANRL